MQRAFAEAEKASWLFTAPNPRVGALALKDGHVVGYGHHSGFGRAHAEEQALRDAGAWDAKKQRMVPGFADELYLSLEPCSSTQKKRPACVRWILEAGIRKVVVGAQDPNPVHAGRGLQQLREHGVEVVHLGLDAEFAQQNPAFLQFLHHPHRPWSLLKWAASVDGYTATKNGKSQWISNTDSRQETHVLRSLSQGVVIGRHTLQADQPRLSARLDGEDPIHQPTKVVVGGCDDVDASHPILQGAALRFWLQSEEPKCLPSWWTDLDHLLVMPSEEAGQVDLPRAVNVLRQEYGMHRILVEGGSTLHASFLQDALADAIVRYEAPVLFGGGLSAAQGLGVLTPQMAWRLQHEERLDLGDNLRRAFLLEPAE